MARKNNKSRTKRMVDFYQKDEKQRLDKNKQKRENRIENLSKREKMANDIKERRDLAKKSKTLPVVAKRAIKETKKMNKMLGRMNLDSSAL